MKQIVALFIFSFSILSNSFSQVTKVVSDCTLTFSVSVEDSKADTSVVKAMSATTKVLYIKGNKSRSDLETPNFKQTIIYDAKTDSSVVLRELGNARYISFLDTNKRREKNKKYEGIEFTKTNDKKTILGYDCTKVVAKLADGSSYDVYYTTSIVPSTTDYEYQFKDLSGLVLEYEAELERGKTKIKYTAIKITITPVPVAKFDIPKSGYRVL